MITTTDGSQPVKIPESYRPLSMWGYFGYEILFALPVVGWIFLVIIALTASNVNLRNFARSKFCVVVIWLIIIAVVVALAMVTGTLDQLK